MAQRPRGRAFKITRKDIKSYGYTRKPGKRHHRNPGVTTIAAINGRGAYSARASMRGLTKKRRLARARTQLTAAQKRAFAKKVGRVRKNGTSKRPRPGTFMSRARRRELRPGQRRAAIKWAEKRTKSLRASRAASTKKTGSNTMAVRRRRRKSATKRAAPRRRKTAHRRRRVAAVAPKRRRRKARKAVAAAPKRRRRVRRHRKNPFTSRTARDAARKRWGKKRRSSKRRSGAHRRVRRGGKRRMTAHRRRSLAAKRAAATRRRNKVAKHMQSSMKAGYRLNRRRRRHHRKNAMVENRRRRRTRRMSANRSHRRNRRHVRRASSNRRRRTHRRNRRHSRRSRRGFRRNASSLLINTLKTGGIVAIGFVAEKLLGGLIRDQLLSRITGSAATATPPATAGLEKLQPYNGLIGSALAAAGGAFVVSKFVKNAETRNLMLAGLGTGFVHTALMLVLDKVGQPAIAAALSGDATATRLAAMYGVGAAASIMPRYAPIGEYFTANGVGEYFQSGVGAYESNPDLYEAAAGVGAEDNAYGRSNHVDPASNLDRELSIAEAAAGVGALQPYEASAGIGEYFQAQAGLGAVTSVPSRSTWIPGSADPQLWAGTRAVNKRQGATEMVPAGLLETPGGQGIFG